MSKTRKGNSTPQVKPVLHIDPKTDNQAKLIKAIKSHDIVVASGPAGCGKTYVSAAMAAKAYAENTIDKIILSRANVPTGRTLGHFPGTVEDKLTPWLTPALDVLRKFLSDGLFTYCLNKKAIQLQPLETIRGRSFEDAFIIIDEAQNLTTEEAISIITRLGEGSTLLLLGDPFQTDIKGQNGLVWFEEFANKYNLEVPVIHFTVEDVVRSQTVKRILKALYTEYQVKA